MNWNAATNELKQALYDHLTGLQGQAIGELDDLEAFTAEVAADILMAVEARRPDLVEEIKDQVKVRAECLRLNASNQVWNAIRLSISVVVGTLFGALQDEVGL